MKCSFFFAVSNFQAVLTSKAFYIVVSVLVETFKLLKYASEVPDILKCICHPRKIVYRLLSFSAQ